MIMLKKVLHFSVKPQCRNTLLNCARIYLQNKELYYSWLSHKNFVHESHNFQIISSIFNYVFHRNQWMRTYSLQSNEVENLCNSVISETSENQENERSEELKKMLSFLLSQGYSVKVIKEKFLPRLKSTNCSYSKLKLLSVIDPDILLLLPLLSLSLTSLQLAAKNAKIDKSVSKEFTTRIEYLSHHLELKPAELIPVVAKHSSLLIMKFSRLHTKMNIFKNANINPKYIVKDLWIFNYNEQLLASRVQAALKAGVELKPWMLRCSEKFFESILIKYSETQRILNGDSVHDYLAKKLDCTVEYVDYMMERNRLLKTINVPKLEQVINFLYEKGYTAEEIRLFPRVFCSSVQTLEKRFEEFQLFKSTLPTLAQLCVSKKTFRKRLHMS